MTANYDALKLENQLCFPLYAASREITKAYKPFLDPLNLTYTQYIVLMVLWEQDGISVKDLGQKLMLDSGTLTPLLKKLEERGVVRRVRSAQDERVVNVELTEAGWALRDEAAKVPMQMATSGCVPLTSEEAMTLYGLLYKILRNCDEPTPESED